MCICVCGPVCVCMAVCACVHMSVCVCVPPSFPDPCDGVMGCCGWHRRPETVSLRWPDHLLWLCVCGHRCVCAQHCEVHASTGQDAVGTTVPAGLAVCQPRPGQQSCVLCVCWRCVLCARVCVTICALFPPPQSAIDLTSLQGTYPGIPSSANNTDLVIIMTAEPSPGQPIAAFATCLQR